MEAGVCVQNRNAIENVSDWSYKNYIMDVSMQTQQIAETNGVNDQSALTC